MSRLTKQLRESMSKEILSHAFSDKQQAADKVKLTAGEKIYTDIYGANLIAMECLPRGMLPKSSHIYIAIAGQKHKVDFNESRVIGFRDYDRHQSGAKLYVGDEPVAIEFLKAVEAVSDIQSKRSAMAREVNAVLESVHTFKKLWEVWPESKSVLEKFEVKPSIAILPAVQVNRLNAELGLPAKTQDDDEPEQSS